LINYLEGVILSYIEKATYDYIKKVLTNGIQVLVSRKFIFFSFLFITVAIGNTVLAFIYSSPTPAEIVTLTWFFLAQIAASLSFVIFGIFGKHIRRWLFRVISVLSLFIIFFGLIGVIYITPSLESLFDLLFQGLPVLFMGLWCIIIPIASFSFVKNMFYSRFTGTILFLGKPDEDRASLFSGLVVICSIVSFFIGYYLISYALSLTTETGLMSYLIVTGALLILLAVYIFFTALGKITSNDVFSSLLSFYLIMSLPIQIMLSITILSGATGTISEWNYLILGFSLIYSAQGVFRKSDTTDIEEKYPDEESLSRKDRKRLEKEKRRDDPFFMSKIIRFIGSEGFVFILLGSLLGYHLLQLQITSGFGNLIFNLVSGGNSKISIIYQSTVIMVIVFVTFFISFTYLISGRVRKYFKPVHYKLGFLPPYDQLKETLEGLKTGEIDWKTFVASNTLKLAAGGVKAGATGTVKTGAAVLSSFAGLLRKGEKKKDN